MSEKQIRAQLSKTNYDTVKKLVKFPQSTSFDDSISQMILEFKELKKQ